MNRRSVKRVVLESLAKRSPETICNDLLKIEEKKLINGLFSALCHKDERVRWHSIYCFGKVVSSLAAKNLEEARIVMRRFLWFLNDESGGIGWGVPEAMASVMKYHDVLRKEYVHMLISYMTEDGEELFQDGNYLELPMLQRGVAWGVGHLCYYHKDEMKKKDIGPQLSLYLSSDDEIVAGLAMWAFGNLGAKHPGDKEIRNKILAFQSNKKPLTFLLGSTIQSTTVGTLAQKALDHIN